MITGVYHPEISGAAKQCHQLVNALKEQVDFTVLTTTRDPNLSPQSKFGDVYIFRLLLNERNFSDYCKASLQLIKVFLSRRKDFQIVHLHGFSLKSCLLTLLSKLFNKKVIIKMSSIGHDDPISMKQRSFLLYFFFSKADIYVGMNPEFNRLYQKTELLSNRYKQIPNCVDTNLFRPVTNREKMTFRDQLGLPKERKLILFVGHFSWEKGADLLLNAWERHVASAFPDTGLVFVGSTKPDHYEVDAQLVRDVQQLAGPYVNERIFFIEKTFKIEMYYQTADIFVLPSLREGLPNALLEAMACGLPLIASKLEGITDWIVEDGENGLLFEPGSRFNLEEGLLRILRNNNSANSLGVEARKTVIEKFSMKRVAKEYAELYRYLDS
jgi:glycosyltransferase involved in cell wall biosynthesis